MHETAMHETAPITPARRHIRLLIVDDHELVREGLVAMLSREEDFMVVGTASDGEAALALYRETRPDVILTDLRMAPVDGIETITAIRAIDPSARAILLTAFDADEQVYQGLKAGAASYLPKSVTMVDLCDTVRAVHNGERRIPESIAAKLADHLAMPELTARQLDTLRLVVDGLSNREIANRLNVTEGTVKAHVKAILAKVGARDRVQAATIAIRRGLVRAP